MARAIPLILDIIEEPTVHVPYVPKDFFLNPPGYDLQQVQWFIANIGSVYAEFDMSPQFLYHTSEEPKKVFVKGPFTTTFSST